MFVLSWPLIEKNNRLTNNVGKGFLTGYFENFSGLDDYYQMELPKQQPGFSNRPFCLNIPLELDSISQPNSFMKLLLEQQLPSTPTLPLVGSSRIRGQ